MGAKHWFLFVVIAFILGAMYPQPVMYVRSKIGV